MPESLVERYPAPIEYKDVRRPFNTVRALAAATLLGVGFVSLANGALVQPWQVLVPGVVVPAAFVMVDGFFRRSHGTSAFPGLLIDITAVTIALIARGGSPSLQTVAFLYFLLTALFLLPLPRAVLALIYAVAGTIVASWVTISTDGEGLAAFFVDAGRDLEVKGTFDAIATALFVTVIAGLLFGAVRSLRRAARRQHEALRTERRASEIKNEFVSMVSHELRTPLTSIAGFTDSLREHWPEYPAEEIDEFLAIMRRETEHLSNLVEDILVIPRLEAGQLRMHPRELDLAKEIFEVADLVFPDSTDHAVNIPPQVRVVADPVRLKQILRNLLENARKYGGDQVLVEGEDHSPGMYAVTVSDNGPGVPREDRSRIFEHFEQVTKGAARLEQGVGLGLPIARKLSRAMGGELWYEPRFPVGARFCFTVALSPASSEADDSDEPRTAETQAVA